MRRSLPEFHLERVTSDGEVSSPEIYPVTCMPSDTNMGRRGFLGSSLTTGAVAAMLSTMPSQAAAQTRRRRTAPAETVLAHRSYVYGLAISPDGSTLVSCSEDHDIKVWNLPGGSLVKAIRESRKPVYFVAMSPDGQRMASASADRRIRIWSLPAAKQQHYMIHGAPVQVVAFTPDGSALASFGSDSILKLWNVSNGDLELQRRGLENAIPILDRWNVSAALQRRLLEPGANITAFKITSNGEFMAYASKSEILVWSLKDDRLVDTISSHSGRIFSISITPDGKRIASAATDRKVVITPLDSNESAITIRNVPSWAISLALSHDGKALASGHSDGSIQLWDAETGDQKGYCFDPKVNLGDGTSFSVYDASLGVSVTYSQPCGAPIPSGATCVCNCVPGTARVPRITVPRVRVRPRMYIPIPNSMPNYGTSCTCNPVCTCIPVFR